MNVWVCGRECGCERLMIMRACMCIGPCACMSAGGRRVAGVPVHDAWSAEREIERRKKLPEIDVVRGS